MGKKERLKAAISEDSSSLEEVKRKRKSPNKAASDDDDDAEANEDLSLQIVQKSIQRAAKSAPRHDGVTEVVRNLKDEKSKKEKKKKRKKNKEVELPGDAVSPESKLVTTEIDAGFKDFCGELFLVDNIKEEEKPESENHKAAEVSSEAVETETKVPDNDVLRKLLRGPRYFDPPDNSWGACYNCGEEGHTTVNCTSARRKKPCFVCGSFEHNAKQCNKGRDCFICKQYGHRAKDCPERNKSSKICLKCGDLGHEMFMCRNDYCPEDLKEIQCYVCGEYGHLCCKDYGDYGPREITCYRCGLSGHTGLACSGSYGRWDTNDKAPDNSCYKCGASGHFARECTSSIKASKRNREPSTPKYKSPKKKRDHLETRSVPHDIGKTLKRKKSKSIAFSSAAKPKHKGGWTSEHPGDYHHGDYHHSQSRDDHWRSPATPRDRKPWTPYSNGDYGSNSHSSRNPRKINFQASPSYGSNKYQHHRYSASRFSSNSNGYGGGRNNDWW